MCEEKSKFHKHHDLIIAWAKGAKIEYFDQVVCEWFGIKDPRWLPAKKYRIKPEPKPDVVAYTRAVCPKKRMSHKEAYKEGLTSWASLVKTHQDNIKCIFDGETGALKSVELIKE